jgi:hypothetical protein
MATKKPLYDDRYLSSNGTPLTGKKTPSIKYQKPTKGTEKIQKLKKVNKTRGY